MTGARLMLAIEAEIYFVALPRAADDGVTAVRLVKAATGAEYTVIRDGPLAVNSCNCPSARHRPELGPCKHARALADVRLIGPPGPASPPLPVPEGRAPRTESHRPTEVTPCTPSPAPSPRPKGRRRGATSG